MEELLLGYKKYINIIKSKKDLKIHKYYKLNLLYGMLEDSI
jgi:hypothetical protein